MRNFFYFLGLLGLLASCGPSRTLYPGSNSVSPPKKLPDAPPEFLDNITIKGTYSAGTSASKPLVIKKTEEAPHSLYSTDIEKSHALQFKYAILLDEYVETVTNEKLIAFMEDWYGTPYRFGGESKKGIDCSAFVCRMMDSIYNIALPRTAQSQFEIGSRIRKDELQQGDLVFFNTTGGVSHVGVYLDNNKFVHASTSMGVMVSDMDDIYFKKRYLGAARVR